MNQIAARFVSNINKQILYEPMNAQTEHLANNILHNALREAMMCGHLTEFQPNNSRYSINWDMIGFEFNLTDHTLNPKNNSTKELLEALYKIEEKE